MIRLNVQKIGDDLLLTVTVNDNRVFNQVILVPTLDSDLDGGAAQEFLFNLIVMLNQLIERTRLVSNMETGNLWLSTDEEMRNSPTAEAHIIDVESSPESPVGSDTSGTSCPALITDESGPESSE